MSDPPLPRDPVRPAWARALLTGGLLLGLNTLAHFVPPERASVAADDYSNRLRFGSQSLREILGLLQTERQRPLQMLAEALQARFLGDGVVGAFLLPYLSSTLLLISAYVLLRVLLGDRSAAISGAIAVSLAPQTIETYHTAMYLNVNVALSLWLLCATAFLSYLRGGSRWGLVAALGLYSVTLFWYELGFFLPLVFLVWGRLLRSPRSRSAILWPSSIFCTATPPRSARLRRQCTDTRLG